MSLISSEIYHVQDIGHIKTFEGSLCLEHSEGPTPDRVNVHHHRSRSTTTAGERVGEDLWAYFFHSHFNCHLKSATQSVLSHGWP